MKDEMLTSTAGDAAGEAPPVGVAPDGSDWAAPFIGALFGAFDAAGLRWMILRNHEDLPDRVGHDVDVVVHPTDAVRVDGLVREVVEQRSLFLVRTYRGLEHHAFDVAASDLSGRLLLHVDVQTGARYRGRLLIDADDLLAHRRREGSLWVPEPAMEAYALLLHAALHKGELKSKYAERLQVLEEAQPGELERVASRRLGPGLGRELAAIRTQTGLLGMRSRLARELDRRHPGNLWRRPSFAVHSAIRQTRLRLRPPGLFVVFLGPDGSGKSSTTDLLTALLGTNSNVLRVHRVYLGSGQPLLPTRKLMRRLHGRTGPRATKSRGVRDVAPRRLRGALHIMVDELIRYWLQVRPRLSPHGIVLADRYAYDILRINNPTVRKPWFRRLVKAITPVPDLTFFLEGDPAVIAARKKELTVEETVRQQHEYRSMASLVPDFRPLDLSRRDDEALRAVALQILDVYAARNQGRPRERGSHG